MNEILKLCPFCGGEAKIECDSAGGDFSPDYYYALCSKCKIESPESFNSEKESIAAWNRRAPATLPTVEELKDLFMEQDGIVITWPKALYFATITHEYLTRRMGGES